MEKIILINPFDAHEHWRQKNGLLHQVAPYSMKQFAGGLLMPNTSPKIITFENLQWYHEEVWEVIGEKQFLPIFTYYLCADLKPEDLRIAWNNKQIRGVKYYPEGGTTASDKGLTGFREVTHILEIMQKLGIPLLIHGETPKIDNEVVVDDEREQVFMETEMSELIKSFPELRIVLEHITTGVAADFVLAHENVWATITPQHCLFDNRALYNGTIIKEGKYSYTLSKNGSNPSFVCRPILKHPRELSRIQSALIKQSTEGLKKFGLGTDTAPHLPEKKYCECGACGVFSAPIALELYAMAFEEIGIIDHLPVFACDVMPEFYDIKHLLPKKTMVIESVPQDIPLSYDGIVTPFAGQTIPWTARMVA